MKRMSCFHPGSYLPSWDLSESNQSNKCNRWKLLSRTDERKTPDRWPIYDRCRQKEKIRSCPCWRHTSRADSLRGQMKESTSNKEEFKVRYWQEKQRSWYQLCGWSWHYSAKYQFWMIHITSHVVTDFNNWYESIDSAFICDICNVHQCHFHFLFDYWHWGNTLS